MISPLTVSPRTSYDQGRFGSYLRLSSWGGGNASCCGFLGESMYRHVRAHAVRFVGLFLALSLLAPIATSHAGGPVMLAGHDSDAPGFQGVYADLFDSILTNVTNGGSGILAIGADPGSTAGNWIVSVASQMTVPQAVTFVNDVAISAQALGGFAILHIPSSSFDTPGGIQETGELNLLNLRAVEVAEFIAVGGGLFGLTQGSDIDDPYAYLGPFADLDTIGLPPSGDCDAGGGSALYDNVTPTPLGNTLGIPDPNIDGCCWHNVFSAYPDFLNILATATEPLCTVPQAIDGLPSVIGCFDCQIPGQMSLAPAQAFNLLGTVHALTATVVESLAPNDPIAGVEVAFAVISGPNFGETGLDTTDATGGADFSYTGDGGPGVDRIEASAEDPSTSDTLTSNVAMKFWDLDCNENGVPDTCDIDCDGFGGDCLLFAGCGLSNDGNSTGIPDDCEGCAIVGPCNDGDACTMNDFCDGFLCEGTPVDCSGLDGQCTTGTCNENTGLCQALPSNEGGSCTDGDLCTTGDMCVTGSCASTPVDCSFLDSQCTDGICNASTGECEQVDANEGGPCNDGNSCNSNDICIEGVCSACGNGSTDAGCGETCDPPIPGLCDPTCLAVVCGNSVIQSGEECDDGNATSGDGCSSSCVFEDKLCIEGVQPSVSRSTKRVAFVSDFDYVAPGNADGNREIFVFERKKLDKEIKRMVRKEGIDPNTAKDQLFATRLPDFFYQVTDTVAPAVNELPTINGTGRTVAFSSNADIKPDAPGNADGNREIFRIDVKRKKKGDPDATVQVTNSPVGIDNLNANMRAYANLLTFDSNGNLAPSVCVGGTNDLGSCTTDEDCPGGACGNPELNREIFIHVHAVFIGGGDQPLRQITAAQSGQSTVGQSVNFFTRATAFTTTADLLSLNPDGNSEIFQIAKTPDSLVAVTSTTGGEHAEAAQAKAAKVALTSNGDLTGINTDGNREIVLYEAEGAPPYRQIGDTLGCLNAVPAIDSRGRYVAFQSTCNRIATLGNPDQSVFMWDDKKQKLLPLVVRGELSAASAGPQVTSKLAVLTYESNLDSIVDPAVCFLNVKLFLKTLEAQP